MTCRCLIPINTLIVPVIYYLWFSPPFNSILESKCLIFSNLAILIPYLIWIRMRLLVIVISIRHKLSLFYIKRMVTSYQFFKILISLLHKHLMSFLYSDLLSTSVILMKYWWCKFLQRINTALAALSDDSDLKKKSPEDKNLDLAHPF